MCAYPLQGFGDFRSAAAQGPYALRSVRLRDADKRAARAYLDGLRWSAEDFARASRMHIGAFEYAGPKRAIVLEIACVPFRVLRKEDAARVASAHLLDRSGSFASTYDAGLAQRIARVADWLDESQGISCDDVNSRLVASFEHEQRIARINGGCIREARKAAELAWRTAIVRGGADV